MSTGFDQSKVPLRLALLICPGVHELQLTEAFLEGWHPRLTSQSNLEAASLERNLDVHIFPGDRQPVYSPLHILNYFCDQVGVPWSAPPVLFVGFSAGVVGAIATAHLWQGMGGTVRSLIALDGWGVPLWASFPIHRLSHDSFTDWSSVLLDRPGSPVDRFYADPPVPHLELWRSPQATGGWQISADGAAHRTTAARYLQTLLNDYGKDEGQSGSKG